MLIDEIVQLLSSDQGSIKEALLKTKILLHKIGHRELVEWVNNELNGYKKDENVPQYRVMHALVEGNVVNIRMRASSHPIPIGHLSDSEREKLEIIPMLDSLEVVSQLASSDSGTLMRPIPLECNHLLDKGFSQGTHVQQAWCKINPVEVQNIIFQVRSRLLDFMLDLKDSLGAATSDDDIKQKASTLDPTSMFNNAIFGPNTTIVVGSDNQQTIDNSIVSCDFDSLSKRLKKLGVDDVAIKELQDIADDEKTKLDKPSLKTQVGDWIKRQVGKQLNLEAQTAIAFSVDAVTQAVRTYFGI